ncbi:MAG: histidine phosphatase family protein [Nocardioidaceae bacterium]
MDVVLIRHGQSGNNLIWEQTGGSAGRDPDTPLTDLGLEQARALARWFAEDPSAPRVTELHTSLMYRAVQTAAPLAEALDLPLRAHRELFEVGGPYEEDEATGERSWHPGSPIEALRAVSSRLEHASDDPWWSGPVEEDGAASARARRVVEGVLGGVREPRPGSCVALVTHGYFSQFLFRALLGISEMDGWIQVDNTAVSHFRVTELGMLALGLNTVPHLTPEQVTA